MADLFENYTELPADVQAIIDYCIKEFLGA